MGCYLSISLSWWGWNLQKWGKVSGFPCPNLLLLYFLGFARDFWVWNRFPPSARTQPNKKLKVETLAGQGDVRSNNFCIHWGLQLPISFHQRFALLQFTGSSGPISGYFRYRCDSHSFAHDAICLVETYIGLEVPSSTFSILHDQFTVHCRAIIDLEAVDSEDDYLTENAIGLVASSCLYVRILSCRLCHTSNLGKKMETNDSPCWSISPQAAISPIYKLATNPTKANTTTL